MWLDTRSRLRLVLLSRFSLRIQIAGLSRVIVSAVVTGGCGDAGAGLDGHMMRAPCFRSMVPRRTGINVNRVFTRIIAGLRGGTGGDADDREGKDTPRLGLASRGVLHQFEAKTFVGPTKRTGGRQIVRV